VPHATAPTHQDIELSIGPHPARPNWRLLRVSYLAGAAHEERIGAALDVLFGAGGMKPTSEPAVGQPTVDRRHRGGSHAGGR
jgi:hypothetical protein